MRLPSLISKDLILNPVANDFIYKCRNRENCLTTGFWTIYDRVVEGQKVAVVVDKEDDLIYLNYLLSKYGLKELSLFVNEDDNLNINYFHSKKMEEEKLRPRLGGQLKDKADLDAEVQQLIEAAKKSITQLHIPQIGNASISDINDQLESSHQKYVDVDANLLRPPYTYEIYSKKKAFFEEIESKYDVTYQYAKEQDPYNETLEELGDISSLNAVLKDFIETAYVVKAKYDKLEQKIASELQENQTEDDLLNSLLVTKLQQLTVATDTSHGVKSLIKEVNALTAELIALNVFNEVPDRKSTSIYHQKKNLENLIQFAEYGLFFVDDNKQYIRWRAYAAKMTPEDHALVKYFTEQNQFWGPAFENLFLQYYLAHSRSTLASADKSLETLDYKSRDLIKIYGTSLLEQHFDQEINWPTQSIKWSSYLNESGQELVKRFPIVFISSACYEKNVAKMAYIDTFIFVNSCPQKLHTEDWLSNLLIGYEASFIAQAEALQKRQPEVAVENSSKIFYQINRSFDHLSLSETNRAAKYLGQEIYKYNKDFKIFQLKNVSLISFLSDAKNAHLIEALASEGIKGVHSNASGVNLIPALLTDDKTKTLIMVEDGVFDFRSDALIPQRQLIQDIRSSGIRLVSIDNYAMTTSGFEILHKLTSQIKKINKAQEELVLIK